MIRFMVIEHILDGKLDEAYERFRSQGRMLPPGLVYVDSWLAKDGLRCFQLMETDDPSTFKTWVREWSDLVRFEIIELGEKPG